MGKCRSVTAAVALTVLAGTTVAGAAPARAEDGLDYAGYVTFERAVAADVDAYWARVVRAGGGNYDSARLVLAGRGQYATSACGAAAGDPDHSRRADVSPAFECPRDDSVYLSSAWTFRELYERFGDFAAAVAIAHEWAHHVQQVVGTDARTTMRLELQADCWAGVWGRDADQRRLVEAGDLDEAAAAL
ncbi:MAG TPA: neutral zinc metallopeptidase, partial [Sporichthya sp.]|nr:neutral zinc metallopeptidase [Sporichthya sp.]